MEGRLIQPVAILMPGETHTRVIVPTRVAEVPARYIADAD